jgi:hypothetical protein
MMRSDLCLAEYNLDMNVLLPQLDSAEKKSKSRIQDLTTIHNSGFVYQSSLPLSKGYGMQTNEAIIRSIPSFKFKAGLFERLVSFLNNMLVHALQVRQNQNWNIHSAV